EVHIGYYYDQYEQAETKHVSCRPLEFLGASNPNLCQTTATCTPESGSLGDVPKKVWWNWRRVACDELQLAPLGPGRASREHAVEAAVCDAAWRPENLLPDLFGSGRVQIGWEVSDMRVVELPAGGLCKQGRLAVYREYCGDDAIAGRRTEVSACSNVVSAVTAVEKNAETINTIQPKGAPRFAEKISPEMLAPEKDYWQFNWSARDESGGVLSTERNEVRRVRLSLRDPANLIRSFERMDGVEDKPLPVQFAQAILRENAERAGAYGWSEYAAKIADYVTVVQREAMVTAITGVYPFVEPVPEIYWGQNDLAKGWDFDRDCQVDAACHGEFVRYENEEQMLRAFAAKQYPQALDTRYVFHAGKSEYALTKIYADASPRNESQQSGFPPCTATKSVCSDGTSADFTELVHLGFGPEVPESCTQGIHHQCFARPYGTAYAAEPLVLEVDQQLIEQVALAEVRRIIPGALSAAQCGKAQTSGCTDVAVAFVDDRRVNVTVSYDMPLVFPLNAITGSNSLRIFQTKEEILERAAVGRETSLELAGLSG
ncbi:MAG TPA: hypothetical protein PLP17_10575, partial [Oligoflexia bacterium]|nr:hypothetical protein [Oligoflexia bacterium]